MFVSSESINVIISFIDPKRKSVIRRLSQTLKFRPRFSSMTWNSPGKVERYENFRGRFDGLWSLNLARIRLYRSGWKSVLFECWIWDGKIGGKTAGKLDFRHVTLSGFGCHETRALARSDDRGASVAHVTNYVRQPCNDCGFFFIFLVLSCWFLSFFMSTIGGIIAMVFLSNIVIVC